MDQSLYIAVDLGAGSGRVFLSGLGNGEFFLEEVRRFSYPPAKIDGHLRWNLPQILDEIKAGLKDASARARNLRRPVQSLAVDSWGVDYGLVDGQGKLLELPICYRDERTAGTMEQVFERVPRREVFQRTGIQFLCFNTLFQLQAHTVAGISDSARYLLLIPDLINFFLTGKAVTEYTNATTTQLINARTGSWDLEMMARVGLPVALLAPVVPAGIDLGPLKADIAAEVNLPEVRVIAPATHDTGSAVAGTPLEDGWAYISSGTWSLVGVERDEVLINDDVATQNFTNEGGAFGTIRFLKNVMGLWILESCRKEWSSYGLDVDYDTLLNQVEALDDSKALIFPDDQRLLNPPSMLDAVTDQLKKFGWNGSAEPATVSRAILDSLALRYASVARSIEKLTGRKVSGLHVVGGGSRNNYLNQATANATRLPVVAGPAEATVTGNVLVQAVAAGRFDSLTAARQHVRENLQTTRFEPGDSAKWESGRQRFNQIEGSYVEV